MIADMLIRDIRGGRYKKDDKTAQRKRNGLPLLACPRADIRKVYGRLKELGCIYSMQGCGSFFAGARERIPAPKMTGGSFSRKDAGDGRNVYESRNVEARADPVQSADLRATRRRRGGPGVEGRAPPRSSAMKRRPSTPATCPKSGIPVARPPTRAASRRCPTTSKGPVGAPDASSGTCRCAQIFSRPKESEAAGRAKSGAGPDAQLPGSSLPDGVSVLELQRTVYAATGLSSLVKRLRLIFRRL